MCGSPAWFLCRTWRKNHKRTFNQHRSRVATFTDTTVHTAHLFGETPEYTIQASRGTDQGEPSDVLTLHEEQLARKRTRLGKAA